MNIETVAALGVGSLILSCAAFVTALHAVNLVLRLDASVAEKWRRDLKEGKGEG